MKTQATPATRPRVVSYSTHIGLAKHEFEKPFWVGWHFESVIRRSAALADLLYAAACCRDFELDKNTLGEIAMLLGEQASLSEALLNTLDLRTASFAPEEAP